MLKPFIKTVSRIVLFLLVFIAVYAIAAFTLPFITINNDFVQNSKEVRLLVISNGVHTDIAMPATNIYKDWTAIFPRDSFDTSDPAYDYIAFGWGDKGFYLDTPTWADLKCSTAFKAAFGLSSSAMHVRYLKSRKKINKNCAEIFISAADYAKLVKYIDNSFAEQGDRPVKINHAGYGDFDRFYEARGTYSLFNTCNCWTNKGLKTAGIKVACWSPFAAGLMGSLPR